MPEVKILTCDAGGKKAPWAYHDCDQIGRCFLGIDQDADYLDMSIRRFKEIENVKIREKYKSMIKDLGIFKTDFLPK